MVGRGGYSKPDGIGEGQNGGKIDSSPLARLCGRGDGGQGCFARPAQKTRRADAAKLAQTKFPPPSCGGGLGWRVLHSPLHDEATAIFKVTNALSAGRHFVTYGGLPSDYYPRLTGAATRMIRGETPLTERVPEKLAER